MVSISTRQVNGGPVEVLDPDDIILRNTGKKPTATQKLVAGAVQSELNSILNSTLTVDGWYEKQTAGSVKDFQKALSLPATGVLDAKTFYQLQIAYESGAKYTSSGTPGKLALVFEAMYERSADPEGGKCRIAGIISLCKYLTGI